MSCRHSITNLSNLPDSTARNVKTRQFSNEIVIHNVYGKCQEKLAAMAETFKDKEHGNNNYKEAKYLVFNLLSGHFQAQAKDVRTAISTQREFDKQRENNYMREFSGEGYVACLEYLADSFFKIYELRLTSPIDKIFIRAQGRKVGVQLCDNFLIPTEYSRLSSDICRTKIHFENLPAGDSSIMPTVLARVVLPSRMVEATIEIQAATNKGVGKNSGKNNNKNKNTGGLFSSKGNGNQNKNNPAATNSAASSKRPLIPLRPLQPAGSGTVSAASSPGVSAQFASLNIDGFHLKPVVEEDESMEVEGEDEKTNNAKAAAASSSTGAAGASASSSRSNQNDLRVPSPVHGPSKPQNNDDLGDEKPPHPRRLPSPPGLPSNNKNSTSAQDQRRGNREQERDRSDQRSQAHRP